MREVRDKLLEEVQALERELRVDLPREIKTALAMGDLRENAEYHAALERQAFVKARIGQLRQRLTELNNMQMSNIPTDRAGLGSTVMLLDLDSKEELAYEIVLPEVADSGQGKLSIASPIGRGLVDKREGDSVVIQIPSGRRRFEVLGIRTIHEKDAGGALPPTQEAKGE